MLLSSRHQSPRSIRIEKNKILTCTHCLFSHLPVVVVVEYLDSVRGGTKWSSLVPSFSFLSSSFPHSMALCLSFLSSLPLFSFCLSFYGPNSPSRYVLTFCNPAVRHLTLSTMMRCLPLHPTPQIYLFACFSPLCLQLPPQHPHNSHHNPKSTFAVYLFFCLAPHQVSRIVNFLHFCILI